MVHLSLYRYLIFYVQSVQSQAGRQTVKVISCVWLFSFVQMLMWINQNFLLQEDLVCEGDLLVTFMSLCGLGLLRLRMSIQGQVAIHTDDMELVGDVIQSGAVSQH